MPDRRLVQGQVANAGRTVQGQYTGPGFQGQGKDPNPDIDLAVQGQPCDDDVEGQNNDSLPYASDRPFAFPNPPIVDQRPGSPADLAASRRQANNSGIDGLPKSGSRRT